MGGKGKDLGAKAVVIRDRCIANNEGCGPFARMLQPGPDSISRRKAKPANRAMRKCRLGTAPGTFARRESINGASVWSRQGCKSWLRSSFEIRRQVDPTDIARPVRVIHERVERICELHRKQSQYMRQVRLVQPRAATKILDSVEGSHVTKGCTVTSMVRTRVTIQCARSKGSSPDSSQYF
jgi:hypothetical protein